MFPLPPGLCRLFPKCFIYEYFLNKVDDEDFVFFRNITKDNVKPILGNIVGCYQNMNPLHIIVKGNIITKISMESSLIESRFN